MDTKRFLSTLLALCLIAALLPATGGTARADWSGSGTADAPYQIGTKAELEKFRDIVNGANGETKNKAACAVLTADINLEDAAWTPIGKDDSNAYSGTFNGAGHEISGLKCEDDTKISAGLFGINKGTVKNVGVSGSIRAHFYVGGIVGENYGTVENCHYTGSVAGDSYVGGVVGYNGNTVQVCYNESAVQGASDYTGGVVGYNENWLKNCYNTGSVKGWDYVGGVLGQNSTLGTYIEHCYSTGSVTKTSSYDHIGGIIGYDEHSDPHAENCYYLDGMARGGICGYDCTNAAQKLTAEQFAIEARFFGWNFKNVWYMDKTAGRPLLRPPVVTLTGSGTADAPYQIGTKAELEKFRDIVNGSNGETQNKAACAVLTADINLEDAAWTPIGTDDSNVYSGTFDGAGHEISGLFVPESLSCSGLFGYIGSKGMVENLSLSGTVAAKAEGVSAGGVAGENYGTVQNCQYTGAVTATATATGGEDCFVCAGGIAGVNYSTVQSCQYTGAVTATATGEESSFAYAGGVTGVNYVKGTVQNCNNTGAVTAAATGEESYAYAGGVAGENRGTVQNCYNTGEVTAADHIGGVVGENTGTVQNCYNTGKVTSEATGHAYIGGVAGENYVTVQNCYFLADASDGGQALSSDDFKKQNSFAGFDFANTWYMGADAPELRAFMKRVSTWSELYAALQNGGGIRLTSDVEYGTGGGANASTELEVPSGVTAVLDLAGHKVDRHAGDTAEADANLIFVHGGNLTLDDSSSGKTGTLTGGNSTGNGGGVYVSGTFTMNGGTISGNTSMQHGGGVCVSSGTFTMNGGTISGNTSGYGSGVYVENNTGFQISGGATVTGNALNGAANNVYLKTGFTITVIGALTDNARIGVTMQTPGVFTSGLSGKGTAANFVSDDTAYAVALNGGEAELVSMIRTMPVVNELQTDGTVEKPLLKGGESADGSTFRYALGTNGTAAPTEGWSGTVPAKKDAGVYYVWVKAVRSTDNVESPAVCIPAKIVIPVTFKVLNGQWNDGTTGDKSLSFIRDANEDLALVLKAEDFPEAGGKPDQNYRKEGSWNPAKPQEKNVSGNETYTFTYTAMDKEPTPAAVFTATGSDSGTLSNVTAGMVYRIGNDTAQAITGTTLSLTGLGPCTITVIQPGNGTTTMNSDPQTITVTKAATPNLAVTQPTTIGGRGSIPTTTAHEFSADGTTWSPCTGETANLAPNTYYVRTAAAGAALASDAQALTVYAFDPGREPAPAAVFTATGPDSGTLTDVTAGMVYRIDNDTAQAITGTTLSLTGLGPCTITLIQPGNGTTTVDSFPQTITVTRAAVPDTVAAAGCTTARNSDGKLTGVTAAMEYKASDADGWTAGTEGNVTGLAPGTYLVRTAASGTVLASDAREVTVAAFAAPPPAPDPTPEPVTEIKSGEPLTADQLDRLIREGKALTVDAADGTKAELSTEALKSIAAQTSESITIEFTREAAEGTEDKTAYDLTISGEGKPLAFIGKAEIIPAGSVQSARTAATPAPEGGRHFVVSGEPFPYQDVSPDSDYYDAVSWAELLGITEGVGDGSFDPAGTCTRAQMVTFLWRAAGRPEPAAAECPFTDLDESAYYYKAVLWAAENGITAGVGDGRFDPEGTVSRAQSVTFLYRALGGGHAEGSSPFLDVEAGAYYENAILWAAENGITLGTGDRTFSPEDDCLRGQIVTFLYRAYTPER